MQRCYGFILLLGVIFFGCSPRETLLENGSTGEILPLYIIKPAGPEPFYFELSADGPGLVPSPAEAALVPYIPWPFSRHIYDFLPVFKDESEEEILYAAINRGGILELKASSEGMAVFYFSGGEIWDNFPLAAFFCYKQKPAGFFTNERFFSAVEQDFPDFPVWILENGSFEAYTIPAINGINSNELRTNAVFLGNDGVWYIKKQIPEKETSCFRTFDLSQLGQAVNAELYLDAASPLKADSPSTPPLLSWAMAEAERLAGKPCIAAVVSPDFPAKRLFGSNKAAGGGAGMGKDDEFSLELYGYYRQELPGKEAKVLLLFPDGRVVYCRSTGAEIKSEHFILPALPSEDFIYTRIALVGENFLVAAWEEQNNWNIGAAGFLLLEFGR